MIYIQDILIFQRYFKVRALPDQKTKSFDRNFVRILPKIEYNFWDAFRGQKENLTLKLLNAKGKDLPHPVPFCFKTPFSLLREKTNRKSKKFTPLKSTSFKIILNVSSDIFTNHISFCFTNTKRNFAIIFGKNMCYKFLLFSVKRPFRPGKDFRRKRRSLVLLSSQREMFPDLGQAAVPMPRSASTVPKRKKRNEGNTSRTSQKFGWYCWCLKSG